MENFIIVITENRHLGLLALPYLVENNENSPSLSLNEKVDTQKPEKYDYQFSDIELELLKILHKLSDKHLFSIYSKDKTIKLFYDNLDKKKLTDIIRPHIEKYMSQCFRFLSSHQQIRVYFKDAKYSNLYKSDIIEVSDILAEPVFYFNLNDEGISYSLKVKLGDDDISLPHKNPMVICHNPCVLLIKNKLYQFDHTDSKKFIPFFSKSEIKIQARSVPSYMETFVTNAIKNHKVVNKGFDIVEDKTKPVAVLSIEQNISQQPVLALKFRYASKEYLANSKSNIAVQLNQSENEFSFTKYKRDIEWENSIIKLIKELGLAEESGANFHPKTNNGQRANTQQVIEWTNQNNIILSENKIEIKQGTLENNYFVGEFSCKLKTTKKNDWFDLQMVIKIGEFEIPFIKFRKYIISGKNEFKLPNDEIFLIPEEWFAQYADLLMFAEEKGDKVRLNSMYYNLLDNNQNFNHKEFTSIAEGKDNNVPEGLNAELRPYQLQGFKWMNYLHNNNFGGILADDMGLGKTLQTITLLLKIYQENKLKTEEAREIQQLNLFEASNLEGFNDSGIPTSLIVMPTSLIHNWLNEFQKFAPKLKIYIYSGAKRLKSKEIGKILRHYHVVLSSYGIVRNDIEFLRHYHFHYTILDESQYIKNPNSKIYEAIMQINCSKKIVLTGTPIENSLSDLWAQMNFVNQGLLGNLNFFKRHYLAPIEKSNSEEHEEKLQKLIEPFVLRRTKEKVAKELPPLTEQVLYCDMTPEQKKFYDAEKSGIRNELLKTFENAGIEKSTFLALQGLTKLRQIANHPIFVDPEYEGKSGKFNMIINNLESIVNEKHKVLIFSSFVKDLDLIEKSLVKRKIKYSKLTGSTSNRQDVVDAFEKQDDCSVFLISLKAGGVGLNLISADYVFLLNPWWNPAAEAQAINRAHRIGQTQNVFVYRFISTETIEEKIMRLQEHKSKLADTFINSNNPFKNMDEAQIKELFS